MRRLLGWVLVGGLMAAACAEQVSDPDQQVPGDALAGREHIETYGCGACHGIPGVRGADAHVGPPLDNWGQRRIIAGQLPNTPENLAAWLENPQEIDPGNAMPDLGVSPEEAQDMAAYLYTLR